MLTDRNIPVSADEVSLEGSGSDGVTIITNDTSKFVIYNLNKPSKNKCCPCPRVFLDYSRMSGRLTGSLQLMWSMGIITLSCVMLILHGAIEAFCVNMSIGVLVRTMITIMHKCLSASLQLSSTCNLTKIKKMVYCKTLDLALTIFFCQRGFMKSQGHRTFTSDHNFMSGDLSLVWFGFIFSKTKHV